MQQQSLPIPEYQQDTLSLIQEYGEQMSSIKGTIESYENEISKLKETLREISDRKLPQLMDELNISEIKLSTGEKISCIDVIDARIQDKDTAHQWLRETNNHGIIKDEITIPFGIGSTEASVKLQNWLIENKYIFNRKETIHPQTLKSFIKEIVPKGVQFPEEAFGLYKARRVVFK